MESRIELGNYFHERGYKVGAEVGVACGFFSEVLCKAIPGLKLYAVDIWDFSPDDDDKTTAKQQKWNYDEARVRLAEYDVKFVKKRSMEAVRLFQDGELDFVYIDASHSFDNSMEDIINWSRKVRKGGVVSGHDYSTKKPGVKLAVDTYVKVHNLKLQVIKYNPKNPTFNKDPSYYWTK